MQPYKIYVNVHLVVWPLFFLLSQSQLNSGCRCPQTSPRKFLCNVSCFGLFFIVHSSQPLYQLLFVLCDLFYIHLLVDQEKHFRTFCCNKWLYLPPSFLSFKYAGFLFFFRFFLECSLVFTLVYLFFNNKLSFYIKNTGLKSRLDIQSNRAHLGNKKHCSNNFDHLSSN